MTLVPKGGGLPPHYLWNGCEFFMRFTLKGRAPKLDFDDAQLMIVFEPEIKMTTRNGTDVRKT